MCARRLGLFGGTFDPPHLAHVAVLRAAWATGRYERILVTVAGEPWQKNERRDVSSPARRLLLAHAAFDDLPGVEVSDREIRRAGPTYTVDTVEELIAEGHDVELILGADAAAGLASWHDAERLRGEVTVAVVPRAGTTAETPATWRTHVLEMAPIDLSSTWLREQIAAGHAIDTLVPPAVVALIGEGEG